jgi:hypothetical protein
MNTKNLCSIISTFINEVTFEGEGRWNKAYPDVKINGQTPTWRELANNIIRTIKNDSTLSKEEKFLQLRNKLPKSPALRRAYNYPEIEGEDSYRAHIAMASEKFRPKDKSSFSKEAFPSIELPKIPKQKDRYDFNHGEW